MQFYVDIIDSTLLIAVLGFSINLLVGYTGLISLAQGAIFGVGAYAAAVGATKAGIPFPLTILLSIAVATALSALVGWPALRVKGEYLILLTLAVQFVLGGVYVAWLPVTGGTTGISGIPRPTFTQQGFTTPSDLIPFVIVIFILGLLVAAWVGHSPFGRSLRAIRENETAAEAIGKHVTYYKVAVFALAGALAGLSGGAFAHYQAFVNPVSFSLDQSIFLLAVIVLGGSGNLLGTIIGAAVLVAFPQLLLLLDLDNQVAGVAQQFLYGLLLVLFMIYRPQGLVPERVRLPLTRLRRLWPSAVTGMAPTSSHGEPPGEDAAPPHVSDRQPPEDHPPAPSPPRERDDHSADAEPQQPETALEAVDLHKSFGGVRPANGLTITLPAGTITALVGPNGAGKTTVFNLLTGYLSLDAGSVRLNGTDITGQPPWRCARQGLARSFQDVRLFPGLPVIDNVVAAVPNQPGETLGSLFGRPWWLARGRRQATRVALENLDFVDLADRADEVTGSLAFGDQKLVAIARLLATQADVLLLDEPASGVDREWINLVLEVVARVATAGKTVCIVEHNLDVVRALAHRAYFMDAGRIIAEGTPQQLMSDEHLATVYFGTKAGRKTRHAHG